MNYSSCQPLQHGHGTHPLLGRHPFIMIQQLKFQQVVVEFGRYSHLLRVIGNARYQAQVVLDKPANS